MTTMCLHSIREVKYAVSYSCHDDGAPKLMRLDYFLHENDYGPDEYSGVSAYEPMKVYCVEVKKTEADSCERSYFADLTTDECKAKGVISLLAENLVTPCCLRDVLEDIFAE